MEIPTRLYALYARSKCIAGILFAYIFGELGDCELNVGLHAAGKILESTYCLSIGLVTHKHLFLFRS